VGFPCLIPFIYDELVLLEGCGVHMRVACVMLLSCVIVSLGLIYFLHYRMMEYGRM